MAKIPTEIQHEMRLLQEENAKLKNQNRKLVQALKEAKSMLNTLGYRGNSIALAGINMVMREVAL